MMRALTKRIQLPAALARLVGECRGVSAVEFALLAPLLISLYLGCAEVSDGVAADRKVTLVAGALANLTASCSNSNTNSGGCSPNTTPPYNISTTEMNNILDASSAIIVPYSASNLAITLSCLTIDANKNATVEWSVTRYGIARTKGAPYIFDSSAMALDIANSQLILAEVSYGYKPVIGYTITGTLTLSDKMFMSPRIAAPAYDGNTCG